MTLAYLIKRQLHKNAILQKVLVFSLIILEFILSKKNIGIIFTRTPFKNKINEQIIDLKLVMGYRDNKSRFNGRRINMINFKDGEILQWKVACPSIYKSTECFFKNILKYKASYFDIGSFFFGIKKEHSVHMSPDSSYICTVCGYYTHIIDVKKNESIIFPEDYLVKLMIYCDTGCFSKDSKYWYTVRWELSDVIDIIDGKRTIITCQVLRVDLINRRLEVLGSIEYRDFIHQITCSPDEKYFIIASFKQDLVVDYPKGSIYTNPEGYRLSHEKGIKPEAIITYEISTGHYWYTDIPTPAPAHPEFDIEDPNIFYISAHNMKLHYSTLFLEGNGAIYKLRIDKGKTQIENYYTDNNFYRITQPDVFKYCGKTYIAVTNTPDKLDIIDCADMSLVKRINVTNAPELDFSKIGSAIAPETPNIYFSANATKDGKHILIGSGSGFLLYNMENENLVSLENVLPENIVLGLGHPRSLGM